MTCVAFRIRRIFAGVPAATPPARPTRIRAGDVSALGNYSAGSSKRSRSPVGIKPYCRGQLTQCDLREPRFRTAGGPDELPESTGLIKELFITGNFLVTLSARVFVYHHFACEGAVDVRGVSGSKDHSYNPPDQPDLQAVVTCSEVSRESTRSSTIPVSQGPGRFHVLYSNFCAAGTRLPCQRMST
jgi:hypothetical protein